MLFAIFSTYISGAVLPETRFDAIVSVMDNMIRRDMAKKACNHLAVKNVKTVLGAAAYRFYRARDEGRRPQVSTDTLLEIAESLYNLDETSSSGSEKIDEYKTLFGAGGLFDESGFRHEFLAATYAAYYLLFLMKRRTKGGNSPIDETAAAALRSGTDYWNSVTEALLCLLDSTSEDSKSYLEPLLEELQNADTPEYDTLCGAVSQFKRRRARAAAVLLYGMLERGCYGIESGSSNNGKFICEKGVNPYEELFYYPSVYPALREFLPNLTKEGGSAEREYLRGELIKEVCALFSENEWESLQSVYDARVDSAYPKSVRKMEKAAQRRNRLEKAAQRRSRLEKGFVRIREGATRICKEAFCHCTGLTSAFIPGSVTAIDSEAFSGCTGLISITIPSGVTKLGESAFFGCTGLVSMTIPANVTSIGDWAISSCTGLESLIVDVANTRYHSADNCIIETKSKALIAGCKNSIIPTDGSVTKICLAAFFRCEGLTKVTFPDSLINIGAKAFRGCTNLTTIIIPSNVAMIGKGAFSFCIELETMTVVTDNYHYHSEDNCIIETWSKTLVAGCKNSIIPVNGSVTKIGDWAFRGRADLTAMTIPNGVTRIGHSAFEDCTGLTSVTVPSSVTQIGCEAFKGCTGLTSVTMQSGVKGIGNSAFVGCTGLTNINIPSSMTKIGESAFDDCPRLTNVTFLDGITEIGDEWLKGCASITNISIPSSVTTIGKGAFKGCNGLTSITIPSSVTMIGDRAFFRCTSLTCVTIPSSVTEIGYEAFYGCTGLTSITIPSSVTVIGKEAFRGCTGLTSIDIPDSVTVIGDKAFYGCSGLEAISVDTANSRYHSENNCIIETESKALIAGCKNSIIPVDGSVTEIDRGAFSNCYLLVSITIPSSVTVIDNSAFKGCTGLTSISIPDSVTEIGYGAFHGCTGLKTVYYTGSEAEWKRINFTSGNYPLTKAEIVFDYRE